MITTPINNWGAALMTSLSAALALFFSALPRVVGFILVIIIGWIGSAILRRAVAGLLRGVRFDNLAERAGLTAFVQSMGVRRAASDLLAEIVQWFVDLIVLAVAFDSLGLPAVSQLLQRMLLWLPNLVVALVVLVIAGLLANALSALIRGASARSGLGQPGLWAGLARAGVWGLGIIVAVNQIGIGSVLVNTLFMGLVGAVALAAGLAFGLGAHDTAGTIIRNGYEHSRTTVPIIRETAQEAQRSVAGGGPSLG